MAVIVHIKNPFDPQNSREVILKDGGKELHEYFDNINDDYEIVASVNGHVTEDFSYIVQQNDSVAFVAIPEGGGGGKNPLRMVAMLAVAIAAPYAVMYMGVMAGVALGTVGMALATAGVMAIGGMIVDSLLPPSMPDFANPSLDGYKSSPTYGWGQTYNETQEGTAIPVIYGTAKIVPPIISQYVETVNDKQYLNILYALAEGEITSVSDIIINDQPIANYSEVTYDTRLGTNTQTLIPSFDNTRTDIGVGSTLTTTYTTRQTVSNNINEFTITISAPNGLYYANDDGGLDNVTVNMSLMYRKVGDIDWIDVEALPSISGKKNTAIRKTFKVTDLASGQYEVQVKRLTQESTQTRTMDKVVFEAIQETIYDDFTYPNTALLSIRALATDQLNGSRPRVSCVITSNSNNPSLVIQDILTNERYGAGVASSNINQTRFDEWASFCTANSYEANIVFDSTISVRDALSTVGQLGRAVVVQAGATFMPIIDKAENLATQRFLFTMGNILKDSFSESFLPLEDRANAIEVTYFDETLSYDRQSVELIQKDFDESTQKKIRNSVTLYGCTDRAQAIKHGRYLLNKNRYLTNTVSFEADIDSIACQVGDIIDVAHDVPQWGYSGRILRAQAENDSTTWVYEDGVYINGVYVDESTLNLVKLDREVTLEAGVDYLLTVKYNSDDSRETVTVNSPTTVITDLIPTPVGFSQPLEDYMLYSIGAYDATLPLHVSNHSKLFRVLSITRSNEQRRKITAIEYVSEVYTDDSDSIPVVSVSSLAKVSSLFGSFSWKPNINGVGGSVVNLDWSGQALSWDVWYRRLTDTVYTYAGTTTKSEFSIEGLPADDYEFKVEEETVNVTVLGKPSVPIEPTGVTATLQGTQIFLEWNHSPYEGIQAYSIKLNGAVIQDGYKGTEFVYTKALANGNYQFSVASVDSYNQASAYADANLITIQAVPSITGVTAYPKATAVQFYVDYTGFSEFSHIQVYENTVNDFGTATELFKQTERNFIRDGLPLVDTRYYWFELVDIYGNHGATFGSVTGSTETDPDNLMLTLKNQQGTAQYLPALSDVMLAGLVNGETVVGIDGSLVVDGSIVADKIGVTQLSAITANVGTMTAGYIQNTAGDAFVNLNANTGTDKFLQISTGNYFQKDGSFQLGGAGGVNYDLSNFTLGSNVVLNSNEINGANINGGNINGVNITGSVIKSSWIDLAGAGYLTNWQLANDIEDPASIYYDYRNNFAKDETGSFVIDGSGYYRLPKVQYVLGSAFSKSASRTSTGTITGYNYNVRAYDDYYVDNTQRFLDSSFNFRTEITNQVALDVSLRFGFSSSSSTFSGSFEWFGDVITYSVTRTATGSYDSTKYTVLIQKNGSTLYTITNGNWFGSSYDSGTITLNGCNFKVNYSSAHLQDTRFWITILDDTNSVTSFTRSSGLKECKCSDVSYSTNYAYPLYVDIDLPTIKET